MTRAWSIAVTVSVLTAVFATSHARADEATAVLDRYRSEQLELRYDGAPRSPLSGPAIYRSGHEVEDAYSELFAPSPLALDHADTYGDYRTWAIVTMVASVASLATATILVVTDDSDGLPLLPACFFVVGLSFSLGGGLLWDAAAHQLNHAVDAYNDDLAARLKSETLTRAGDPSLQR